MVNRAEEVHTLPGSEDTGMNTRPVGFFWELGGILRQGRRARGSEGMGTLYFSYKVPFSFKHLIKRHHHLIKWMLQQLRWKGREVWVSFSLTQSPLLFLRIGSGGGLCRWPSTLDMAGIN